MKLVPEQKMGKEFSSSSISRFSAQLDAELDAWRERAITKEYPYVIVDARYESCRRLFTLLLKEWHEDWAYGRIYLRMDLLKVFEAEERTPAVEESSIEKEKITMA